MSELVHADIFFFVTTIAVVILTIGLALFLYYAIRILRDVQAVTKKIRRAGDTLERDFGELRTNLRREGLRTKTAFELVLEFVARKFRKE